MSNLDIIRIAIIRRPTDRSQQKQDRCSATLCHKH